VADEATLFRRRADGLDILVRVQPKASRDMVEGVAHAADGTQRLKVRLRAAPDKGAANGALVALLATRLGVAKSAVMVTAGRAARIKTVHVAGDPAALEQALARLLDTAPDERC
jgi:uncharacterized protein (TIGR00251 family)